LGVHRRTILRRIAWIAVALAGCSAADEVSRYLDDAPFRRARLVASLVNPDNGYSRLRLAQYATGAPGDWDALPIFNPPVATLDSDGNRRDDERALDVTPAIGSVDELALGQDAFFRYPVQLLPGLTGAAGTLVSARLADGSDAAALTCASCHARVVDGTLTAGLANETIDLGWGPGRIVVSAPGDAPIAIPDLRTTALQAYLQRDGTVRNDGVVALAIRIETLIITSHEGAVRPPREIALALARWLATLAPPPPMTPPTASAAARGAELFAQGCAGCHVPPSFAGGIVPLAIIGTDPAVGLSSDRGTGGYRVPSLRGVSTRGRLLHDASVADLPTLFDPSRTIAGHKFGLELPAADRDALIVYLATL
jgi:mono/diheme cytochrome c family protein